MNRFVVLLVLVCMYASPFAAEDTLIRVPVSSPPVLSDQEEMEPEVTIIQRKEETLEEYRINGVLYMIKVTPKKGKQYFLVDSDGNGSLDARTTELDPAIDDTQLGNISLVNLQSLQRILDALAEWTGRSASWLALLLVLVTFTVVVLRYAFNIGSIALQESILYLHASLFLLAAAYTLKQDAHVRVDIFYREFSPENKAWVDLFGALFLLLPVCLFLFWVSWDYVTAAWSLKEGSREAGGLPYVYLLKSLIPLTIILLSLQGISQIIASLVTLLVPDKEKHS